MMIKPTRELESQEKGPALTFEWSNGLSSLLRLELRSWNVRRLSMT